MNSTPTLRTLHHNARTLHYTLTRKPVRNINLRIKSDGSVMVSANSRVGIGQIEDFIRSKWDYIFEHLHKFSQQKEHTHTPHFYESGEVFYLFGRPHVLKVEQGVPEGVRITAGECLQMHIRDTANLGAKQRLMDKFYDKLCREIFYAIAENTYPLFEAYKFPYPTIKMRMMKTRWGSCSPSKAQITLNKKLIETPESCIEYVVLHEFAHFVHPNHSGAFYELVGLFMPEWKERRKLLRDYREYTENAD